MRPTGSPRHGAWCDGCGWGGATTPQVGRGRGPMTVVQPATRTCRRATSHRPRPQSRPQVERALARRARQAFKGETPDGRRLRGADLTIGFKASGTATEVPSGTIQTRWTGVLVDLEITG